MLRLTFSCHMGYRICTVYIHLETLECLIKSDAEHCFWKQTLYLYIVIVFESCHFHNN